MQAAPPSTEYLRDIYVGIRKTFGQFSEFLIMYYLYRIEGVKESYSIEEMKNTFFTVDTDVKFTSNRENSPKPKNLETSPLSKDGTVKCFTCNNSDDVNSIEKEYLNDHSFVFNLNHLPVFDQHSCSFVWGGNEPNWRNTMEKIVENEEFKNKKPTSVSNGSFLEGSSIEMKDESAADKAKIQKESRFFLEELNKMLNEIETKEN